MSAATIRCPFCDHPIPLHLTAGKTVNGVIEVIADTRDIELHIRYCAKNPEATPI